LDDEIATKLTSFKSEYVLPIGDIPVRTVVMGVSTGAAYVLCGRWNRTFLGRTRNFALLFTLNGLFWLP
jgi:hypothetical protein